MEKIKFTGEISASLVASACANKINEIIDELHTINVQKVTIDRLVEEDRLKTLEDKIEFIMKNGAGLKGVILKSGSETLSHYETAPLQDLWDEQNEANVNRSFYVNSEPTVKESIAPYDIKAQTTRTIIKPTVKECNCSISDYTDIEDGEQCFICHRKIKKPSVKECDSKGNIVMNSNPLVDELLEKYNKDQKIEEIISYVNNLRWKHKIKELTIDDYYDLHNRDIDYLASWLRDKLRDICK